MNSAKEDKRKVHKKAAKILFLYKNETECYNNKQKTGGGGEKVLILLGTKDTFMCANYSIFLCNFLCVLSFFLCHCCNYNLTACKCNEKGEETFLCTYVAFLVRLLSALSTTVIGFS